jgi:hypothetical protein
MKWFKSFLPIVPIIFLTVQIGFFYHFQQHSLTLNPLSSDNSAISTLTDQLRLSQITPLDLRVFSYRHEAEFFISGNDHPLKVIISMQNDTLSQVTVLQKMIKNDKITKDINFIDLSSRPAYATFQNF